MRQLVHNSVTRSDVHDRLKSELAALLAEHPAADLSQDALRSRLKQSVREAGEKIEDRVKVLRPKREARVEERVSEEECRRKREVPRAGVKEKMNARDRQRETM